jgi:hypothetical protein
MSPIRSLSVVAVLILSPVALIADTLVLRNGTRARGDLVAVRNGVVEFEERSGSGRSRTLRIDRDEVARIEFEENLPPSAGSAGGRPSGLRERQVLVSASTQWTDAGIDVRQGQTIYVEARGEVRWGRDRRDGPEGERNSPRNPGRPMPNRPAAALIGKIGSESNDPFFIGADTAGIRVRGSGRLFLGINDEFLQDNGGSFTVIVYY